MTSSAPLASALVLLLTALPSAPGHPAGGRGDRQQASWDQVNVVAHGLLQLGQALKEHVDKSRTQLRELSGGLRSLNASLLRLQEEQRVSGTAGGQQELTRSGTVQEVEELRRRMDRLEQRVEEVDRRPEHDRNSSDDKETFIQKLMAAQNRRMDQLLDKIRQQQDKLDKQSVHLQALHNKIGHKRMKSLRHRHDELQKDDRRQKGFARDCHELFVRGQRKSGVYTVQPESSKPFQVLCDMTPEGGWTVIQKRFDGSQSFEQTWDSYRRGFGRLDGEFWLGLDHIRALSTQGLLQMELTDWSRQSHVISSEFQLDGEEKQFSLRLVPGSSGSSGSSESSGSSGSSGLPFSTADCDNDLSAENNCAQTHSGGWWFSSCGDSNLNGEFPSSPGGSRDMFWTTSEGHRTALRSTVMKIAPASVQH